MPVNSPEQATDEVWVELETNKGTTSVATYRGRTTRAEVEAWLEGTLGRRCLRLRNVYWVEDVYADDPYVSEPVRYNYVILGQARGKFSNFTGEVFVRGDTIVVIMLLKDGNEWERESEGDRDGQLLRLAPK